ncbi:hypothetical protein TREMEDRAFT_24652 [Tremella mesenterica DSM 1558]|uniref:uncharacterized protein n=1 Tax=Tremella mesenterica (strain ATCC 24925 / CBS 8224 / DSM 1558 / NBRC 9311 / NRRL Y-6157 / RJB 2259-6 / UBC 559-6) TaxID=578456 RepID=UPI0003F496C0|nr:uncharacterized protein TREMEDRAFT_24652 [Tremella mesenterica DSM 1558]EIW72790.1 hypothetical protein TREMEDRAFT_24652 [Tremella mesenterica DSM 1558]
MSSLDLTNQWLRTVLQPYPSRERILPEVMDVLAQWRTLSVKTEAFTFDTGHTALLLLLHGTLPITYRGATYQIPIHIWVPTEYPRAPPLVFVVPTAEMGIRKSHEVEPGGRVRDIVVEEWWGSWEIKTIGVLLRHLTDLFSLTPPVYARPPDQPKSPSIATPHRPSSAAGPAAGPSVMTLPSYKPSTNPSAGQYTPQSPIRQSFIPFSPQSPQSPPVPQRPHAGPSRNDSLPSQMSGPSQQSFMPNINPPLASSPQPQHPAFSGQSIAAHILEPLRHHTPPIPPRGFTPAHPQINTHSPDHSSQVYHPHDTPPPTVPSHPQHSPPAHSVPTRKPIADLLSSPLSSTTALPSDSAEKTAPPPLPPSKPPPPSLLHLHSILLPHLNASLPPLIQSLQTNRNHLLERREDLTSGEPAIRDEMARLLAVKKVCDSTGRKMEDVVARAEERVADLEQRGEVSVDELVCGISIVHNQLIDLVAEDNAIEDTIYHLTRALDAERIDLDRFLKSIRSLAREQYMKRALVERILTGMGQKQDW